MCVCVNLPIWFGSMHGHVGAYCMDIARSRFTEHRRPISTMHHSPGAFALDDLHVETLISVWCVEPFNAFIFIFWNETTEMNGKKRGCVVSFIFLFVYKKVNERTARMQ